MRKSITSNIPNTASVKYFFPIFKWKECDGCLSNVLLETMRVVYDDEFSTRFNGAIFRKRKYYCKLCAWSHEQAYIKYYVYMNHVRTEILNRVDKPNLRVIK